MGNIKFKFKIGNDVHEWPDKIITYEDLAAIPPGIPEGAALFIKRHGKPGELIKPGDRFDLSEPGIEKFYVDDARAGAGSHALV